ncbi:MAG: hypothetical protein NTW19_06380, partial [Planctomycetota bacterium]|nr:hypothetical protein [Planctomycetota bacterium]
MPAPTPAPVPLATRALGFLLTLAAMFVCAFATQSLAARQTRMPHGDWDAWMIWNLKARFFYRAGPGWAAVLTDGWSWSHPDYPLLLPLTVARYWHYLGLETVLVPQGVTIFITLMLFALLYAGLAYLRGWIQAALALLFLASSGFFLKCGAMQCADIPLALFMLATCVAFIATRRGESGSYVIRSDSAAALVGLFAAAGAWTKNEGLLFAAGLFAVAAVGSLLQRDRPAAIRRLAPAFAGLFPLGMILAAMKLVLAGGTDLFVEQKHRTARDFLDMALSFDRHDMIWRF